jgi:hypothetical protein
MLFAAEAKQVATDAHGYRNRMNKGDLRFRNTNTDNKFVNPVEHTSSSLPEPASITPDIASAKVQVRGIMLLHARVEELEKALAAKSVDPRYESLLYRLITVYTDNGDDELKSYRAIVEEISKD